MWQQIMSVVRDNKRSEAVYKDLPMVVYPQKDTMLAAQCKFGIVYLQAHRERALMRFYLAICMQFDYWHAHRGKTQQIASQAGRCPRWGSS